MQHGLRRHFVGGVSGILRRLERGKQEWARTRHTGIDEQGEIAPFQINRVLDLELEIGDQLEFGPVGILLPTLDKQIEQLRPKGVVAPARIAVSEDKQRRLQAVHTIFHALQRIESRSALVVHRPSEFLFNRSITFPPTSTSSTSSGILPTAWVAQDRHGSKARIATSMWLSRPRSEERRVGKECRSRWSPYH